MWLIKCEILVLYWKNLLFEFFLCPPVTNLPIPLIFFQKFTSCFIEINPRDDHLAALSCVILKSKILALKSSPQKNLLLKNFNVTTTAVPVTTSLLPVAACRCCPFPSIFFIPYDSSQTTHPRLLRIIYLDLWKMRLFIFPYNHFNISPIEIV